MIYRVYFNKRGVLPWSIDTGQDTPELHAVSIICENTSFCSTHNPKAGDNINTPTAWFMVQGTATWDGDTVKIKGAT